MRIGIIDLGTLSLRLDVFELDSANRARSVFRHRNMLRLGENSFQSGALSPEAHQRTIEEFFKIQTLLDSQKVNIVRAAGTSALRDTIGGKELIEEIKRLTGIQVQIISGEEEAKLTAIGILANETISSDAIALVDIGGGSTEISFCSKTQVYSSHSLPLGASRLKQQFNFEDSEFSFEQIYAVRLHIRSALAGLREIKSAHPATQILGSSGTIRSLVALDKPRSDKSRSITRIELKQLISRMLSKTRYELLQIPGMEDARVDVIIPGAIIFEEIMDYLGINNARATQYSLRHGLLEDELKKIRANL